MAWVRRILVVEDEPFVRGLVGETLRRAGFDVRTAANATEALARAADFDPDGAVLDIDLGDGPNGLDVSDALGVHYPHMAIVFLTQMPAPEVVGRAEAMPRAAYLIKRELSDPRVLVDALELVLRDGNPNPEFRADLERRDPLARLSPAQLDTLRCITQGFSNDEIARTRGTSVRAVEAMVSRIFAILEVASDPRLSPRVAAARVYLDNAGVPPIGEVKG